MNTARNFTLVLLAVVLILAIAACSPKSAKVTSQSPVPGTKELSPPEQEKQESQWDKTLKSAIQERKVTIYGSEGGSVRADLVEGFKKRYGLDVEWTSGSPAELQNRILTERKAGLYVPDIVMVGPTTLPVNLKELGVLQTMDNFLILPEVKDPLQWHQNKFPWFDPAHIAVAHSGLLVRLLTINNQVVRQSEITTFEELLNTKWKGKLSINDPTFGGTGQVGFGMLGEYIMGWDFVRKLAQQEPFVTRDYRLQIDWLANGKYPVAIAARSEGFNEYIKAGAPISYLTIPKASYASAGSAGISILSKSPHHNAATIYVNWFLSREGQMVYSKARGYQSMRLDVPTEHLDPNILRDPKINYPDSSSPEALALRDEWERKSKEIFGPLVNR